MVAGRDGLANVTRAVLLDHGGPGVMHARHHRRGCTFASEPFDHQRGSTLRLAQSANLGCTDQAQQSRTTQCVDRRAWERAVLIDLDGVRCATSVVTLPSVSRYVSAVTCSSLGCPISIEYHKLQ